MLTKRKIPHRAWVLTVDMGYGHQRAAQPLHYFAAGGIISANSYPGVPKKDRDLWSKSQGLYEFISRFKKVPLIGERAFELFDRLQSIPNFYPKRDLSQANFQLKQIYRLFGENNWGRHLIAKLARRPLPLVTTFFVTAFMAEYWNYPGEIYCIPTDTDISRAWVPKNPRSSRIIYLAPNRRVEERLMLYGVKRENVFYTGFPLPEENIGDNFKIVKHDLGQRLINLDPTQFYIAQYQETIKHHLGKNLIKKSIRPLTITFAVGGAGAQRELGAQIITSLKKEIQDGQIAVNLMAGTHMVVNKFFKDAAKDAGLGKKLGRGVNVLFYEDKNEYFMKFNQLLRSTDILWTKPSELSFYCALGLPIIIAPPIGSQEMFNQRWLRTIGAGIKQDDVRYTNEWLADWLESGWLAEAAMQGFLEASKAGTHNIDKTIFHQYKEVREIKTVSQY